MKHLEFSCNQKKWELASIQAFYHNLLHWLHCACSAGPNNKILFRILFAFKGCDNHFYDLFQNGLLIVF